VASTLKRLQPHKRENSHSAEAQPRPRAGNERNAKHQIANHDGPITISHREAPVREPHWLAGRQRTDGSGVGRELALCLFTQKCEPPNVRHERHLEAGEARCKVSARWRG
jgi:hypothetical protein